jgi:hypothetical protein
LSKVGEDFLQLSTVGIPSPVFWIDSTGAIHSASTAGPATFPLIYAGNVTPNNGDSITGIVVDGATTQFALDQVGISLTSVWAPNNASPPTPYHFGYDSLIYSGLGAGNTVSSLTLAATGVFSANWGLTAAAGQTVSQADGVGFIANVPLFAGAGTMSMTRNSGFWAANQGNANIATSYGLRVDAQSGSTTNYAIATLGTGLVKFSDTLQTSGVQNKIAAKTGSYVLTLNDEVVFADCTTGSYTFTLPSAASALSGLNASKFTIKRIDSSGNTCIVVGTIDGATNYALSAQYKYVTVTTNGTSWFIIGNN